MPAHRRALRQTRTLAAKACPAYYKGKWPICIKIPCPIYTTGSYPNCRKIQCPAGTTGTYPNCKKCYNVNGKERCVAMG